MDVIAVENLTKHYGTTVALDGVSFAVRAGEVHALVGENGSGKSTLCKVLHGEADVIDTGGYVGCVRIAGEEVVLSSPEDALRHGIAYVHQETALVPQMTVAENIVLGCEPVSRGWPLPPVDARAMSGYAVRALAALGVDLDVTRTVGDLPTGMRQLVEAAREMSRNGIRALVLDEPSAALSQAETQALGVLIRSAAAKGIAVLLVSHRLSEVLELADRVTVIRDGRVVGTWSSEETNAGELARFMVGDDAVLPSARSRRPSSDVALEFAGLSVAMPGDPLRELSLAVRAGEIVGITAQAGHGRLALTSGLLGLYPATGQVWVRGVRLDLGDPVAPERCGLSVVHEDRRTVALEASESIAVNITLPSFVAGRKFVRMSRLPGGGFLDHAAVNQTAEVLVKRFGIRCGSIHQPVGELSGGSQQKVIIARSVASEPRALVVSEPTRGIDVRAKDTVLAALTAIADDGVAVLVISGEVAELERVCDRIVVLRQGRMCAEFEPPYQGAEIELAVVGETSTVRS